MKLFCSIKSYKSRTRSWATKTLFCSSRNPQMNGVSSLQNSDSEDNLWSVYAQTSQGKRA